MTRFVSDSLKFTGTELGQDAGFWGSEEEDEEDESSDGEDNLEEQLARIPPKEREEFLVQSAMARIERARAMGRNDVNLNKHELAALDRRQKREEERKRKKRKDQRVAIPLTQIDPVSRKKGSRSSRQDLPRHSSSSNMGDDQDYREGYPPMGYFPPPSRSRQQSGASNPQLALDYMQGTSRTASEPMLDPFQFQTQQMTGDMDSARRYASGPAASAGRRRRSTMDGNTSSGDDSNPGASSSGEEELSSDNTGPSVHAREASRGRAPVADSGKPSAAKKAKNPSPSKRKPPAKPATRRKK